MNLSVLGFFFLRFVSCFIPLWSEEVLDMISIFLNLLRLALCPIMWSIFENVPCAFKKNVYFASLGWEALYIYQLSPFDLGHCSMPQSLCRYLVWKICPFFDSGVLKSPTVIVLLSISFLKSSKIFFMYLGAPMLGACIFTMFVFFVGGFFLWVLWSYFPGLSLWPFFGSLFCLVWVLLPLLFYFLFICLENLFPALHFQSV